MKRIGETGFMEKPLPEDPGPNDGIIKTTTAMVCTSDTHTVKGAIGERSNLTLGHEAVGVVYKLGREVTGFKEGDRVAVNAITPCFHCDNCVRGYTSQCTDMLGGWKFANVKDGVFAEYFHVNSAAANLVRISDSVPDDVAVYTCDMMSTGFAGAENADIPVGGTLAVFAQGPVGLMATVGARLQGAGLVIAVETMPERQELARHYGADVVVDFRKEDAVQAILDLTDGAHRAILRLFFACGWWSVRAANCFASCMPNRPKPVKRAPPIAMRRFSPGALPDLLHNVTPRTLIPSRGSCAKPHTCAAVPQLRCCTDSVAGQ